MMKKILIPIIVILLLLSSACLNYPRTYHQPVSTYKPAPTENLNNSLKIKLLDQDFSDNYITLTYKITNNSKSHYFTYVKVKVSLLDADKKVLTSDWTYAVDSTSLAPNESKEFDIMIERPLSGDVQYFNCSVIEYD
jgi:hypothetical protein